VMPDTWLQPTAEDLLAMLGNALAYLSTLGRG
jgi:hypothetical protein